MLTHSPRTARKIRAVIISGRGIRKLVTLRRTITQLVNESDRRLPRSEDDDDDDKEEEDESPEQKEEVQRRVLSLDNSHF